MYSVAWCEFHGSLLERTVNVVIINSTVLPVPPPTPSSTPDAHTHRFTMDTPTAGFSNYGFSVVHTNCLSNFSHIHELGHNFGANHDAANAQTDHTYSYAYRKCTGEKP